MSVFNKELLSCLLTYLRLKTYLNTVSLSLILYNASYLTCLFLIHATSHITLFILYTVARILLSHK